MSMSISDLIIHLVGRVRPFKIYEFALIDRGGALELDLDTGGGDVTVGHRLLPVVEDQLIAVDRREASGEARAVVQRDRDHPGARPLEVAQLGQRSARARGGHLEGERTRQRGVDVQQVGDLAGDLGNLVQAQRAGLVLTEVDYPGWKATIDGRPAKIERVNYLMRGVVVPPGKHTVEMRYEPKSWTVGWIITAFSLVILAALVVLGLVRRRRES